MTNPDSTGAHSRGSAGRPGAPGNSLQVAILVVALGTLGVEIFHVSQSAGPPACPPAPQCASCDLGTVGEKLPGWEDYRRELQSVCGKAEPGTTVKEPDTTVKTVDKAVKPPDKTGKTPDMVAKTPGKPGKTPDMGVKAAGKPLKTPDMGGGKEPPAD